MFDESVERINPKMNAVVVTLHRVHDSEEGKPQYSRMYHIECKDDDMKERLQELARDLMP